MHPPARTAITLLLVAALAGACSSGDSDPASTTEKRTTRTTSTTSTTSTTEATTTTTASPSFLDGVRAEEVVLRPVLRSAPCPGAKNPPAGSRPEASLPATPPSVPEGAGLPSSDGFLCYRLGPETLSGTDLQQARAEQDPTGAAWQVLAQVRSEAEDRWNTVFDACAQASPTCPAFGGPAGSIAIVARGVVLSAPAVQAPGLARAPFQISGNLTKAEATSLADALNH